MKTVTENQKKLADNMIESMPDTCLLADVLTAGALFLTNAIIQSPKCDLSFEEVFEIVSLTTSRLVTINEGGDK